MAAFLNETKLDEGSSDSTVTITGYVLISRRRAPERAAAGEGESPGSRLNPDSFFRLFYNDIFFIER